MAKVEHRRSRIAAIVAAGSVTAGLIGFKSGGNQPEGGAPEHSLKSVPQDLRQSTLPSFRFLDRRDAVPRHGSGGSRSVEMKIGQRLEDAAAIRLSGQEGAKAPPRALTKEVPRSKK